MLSITEAVEHVAPFVSTDPDRPALNRPWKHHTTIVGCNGHTLAAARFDGEGEDTRLASEGEPVPPYVQVLPTALAFVGEVAADAIERFRHYPSKWLVSVTIDRGGVWARAEIPARVHAKSKKVLRPAVCMIDRDAVDGFQGVMVWEPIAMNGHYLGDAVAMVAGVTGLAFVCMHTTGGPLDPVIFTPRQCATRDDLMGCEAFALVMPMRL
jgi:hypothetical protein